MNAFFYGILDFLIYGLLSAAGGALSYLGIYLVGRGLNFDDHNYIFFLLGGIVICFMAGYLVIFSIVKLCYKIVRLLQKEEAKELK